MNVRYEVVAEVEHGLAEQYRNYMQTKHIPEIWATGCFTTIVFSQTSPNIFRAAYIAANQAALDRYLSNHTAHFRTDFSQHFPHGVHVSRTIWTDLNSWE
jgi:hypothetical protein